MVEVSGQAPHRPGFVTAWRCPDRGVWQACRGCCVSAKPVNGMLLPLMLKMGAYEYHLIQRNARNGPVELLARRAVFRLKICPALRTRRLVSSATSQLAEV